MAQTKAESLQGLRKDFDKLAKRQRASNTKVNNDIGDMIQHLTAARDFLRASDETVSLVNTHKKVKAAYSDIVSEQKEAHNAQSKFGKLMDKTFKSDIGLASDPHAFDDKKQQLNETIAHHFYRQGRFKLGEMFAAEAHLLIEEAIKSRFVEMFDILEAMKVQNLLPALRWALVNHDRLEAKGSNVEFKLHRLQYLSLLTSGDKVGAITYAKQHFDRLSAVHMKEIQRLMGTLLFANRLDKSPYADLISPTHWIDIQHTFTRDCCALLGLSQESPIFVSISTGAMALPTLLKMSRVMQAKKTEWSQQDELPVEIPLGKEHTYHSIFVCPVAKEQVTRTNPPMMIPCGHVICQESLTKLTKGNGRLKCPYCPTEAIKTQAKRVCF